MVKARFSGSIEWRCSELPFREWFEEEWRRGEGEKKSSSLCVGFER